MISVLIVNYFSFTLTVRAIRSVLSDQPSAQIIVVDNSDDAAEAISLSAILPGGVKLIVAQSNLGFGRACNLALNYSHGEWIFLLNPDAFVLPGFLTNWLKHFSAILMLVQFHQWRNGIKLQPFSCHQAKCKAQPGNGCSRWESGCRL